jgi:hypothetical protein
MAPPTLKSLIRIAALAWLAPMLGLAIAAPPTLSPPPSPPPPLTPADGAAIVAAWQDAAAQGLPPRDLRPQLSALASSDPAAHAKAEQALTQAAVDYAKAERGMAPDPKTIDRDFALRAPFDAPADFDRARAAGQASAWIAAQTRHDPGFLALVAARGRYGQILAKGDGVS